MKAKVTVFFGAVVLALLAAACSNPAAEAPREGTGRILVSIGVEGAESLQPAESRIAGAAARTVVPAGLSTSTFSKFEAVFTATSGGSNHGPVPLSGGTEAINLEVGTYTVTITGYTGSDPAFIAAAEGSVAGVVVTLGGTTPASVLLGPKTGADTGTFSYDITIPTGASGDLTVTTITGGTVSDGDVTLTPGTGTAGTITLTGGYYQVVVSLTKEGESAGVVEVIHIYPGLTSALAAQTFTDADFAPVVTVSDFDLSGKFAAPAVGEPADTTFNTSQYTGAIVWFPAVSGTFAGSETYTATITLTAKPGYTFIGVGQDAFNYTGTTPTNTADTGVISIAFAATYAYAGTASMSYTVDNGEIDVMASPSNKTIRKGEIVKLDLTAPAGYTVTGWYIDGAKAEALGTELSVNLDPDAYTARTHSVSVFATKDGRPYSWRDTFTVLAGGGGSGDPLDMFIAATQTMETNTPDTPLTLKLDASVDIEANTTTLYEALRKSVMAGKYIVVDLSDYTWTETPNTFCLAFAVESVVGVIYPDGLTAIGTDFSFSYEGEYEEYSGLRSVTIPATVSSISGGSFFECPNLTRIIFEGNLIASLGGGRFEADFRTCYNNQGTKAGTYVKNDGTWSKL
jgi:hypothetical protein